MLCGEDRAELRGGGIAAENWGLWSRELGGQPDLLEEETPGVTCTVTLTADWKGSELYFMDVQRGEGEEKREQQSLWRVLSSVKG